MIQSNPKHVPIRSSKLLNSARGQPCSLNFFGVCNHDPETTVSAHLHDETFGMGMKADDFDSVHACSACHMFLDHGWVGKISQTLLLRHIIRAMQRTTRDRVVRGLIVIALDPERLSSDRVTKPRKPKSERATIRGKTAFPEQSRPMQSRNTLRRPHQESKS